MISFVRTKNAAFINPSRASPTIVAWKDSTFGTRASRILHSVTPTGASPLPAKFLTVGNVGQCCFNQPQAIGKDKKDKDRTLYKQSISLSLVGFEADRLVSFMSLVSNQDVVVVNGICTNSRDWRW